MRRTVSAAIPALVLVLWSVASPSCSRARTEGGVERASAKRTDVITRAEIEKQHWGSAHDLVATLRPQWLNDRGPDSFEAPTVLQVHLNETRVGGVSMLRQMTVSDLAYVEYLDPSAATARWGLGYGRGAINLSTRPR